jgi:hypothetical protein
MSVSNNSADLSSAQTPPSLPEFFSAHSGAAITGTSAKTIRVDCPPDAIEHGYQGKRYGLYSEATLRAWAASRSGGRGTGRKNLHGGASA